METIAVLLILQIYPTSCPPVRGHRSVIRLDVYKSMKPVERSHCRDDSDRCLKLKKALQGEDRTPSTTSTAPPTVGTRKDTTTPLNVSINMEKCADVAKCNVNIWYD